MMRSRTLPAVFTAILFCGISAASAQEALRPEVGKPLARAKSLLAAHRFPEAMAQVRAAAAVRGLSANESFVVEEMRGAIAETARDFPTASRTYATLLQSGKVSSSERIRMLLAETSMAYEMKSYPAVASWAQQYFKAGGNAPEVHTLQIQAYYLQHDYASAEKLQAAQIAGEVAARQKPTEQQLQLLARSQQEGGDKLGFGNTMVQLVTYYPKPDYWANLVSAAQTRPGFNDRLTLDIDRFELAIGTLTRPADLMEMVELALQVPLPGEAKRVTDAGFAAGTLGVGAEASRQQRLRALVDKTYAEEKPKLAGRVADAKASHDGNLAAALGEEYVSYDDFAAGLPLLQLALQKGSLRHPDDTRLHLGIALMRAGQKLQAVRMLRSVGGTDGAAEIARLWTLQMSKT